MEGAIQTMVKVFLKSSKGKERLGKKEFQELVTTELSNILTDTDSKEAINKMGQDLDADKDGKLGFEEYMKLVGNLADFLSKQRDLDPEKPAQNASSKPVAQKKPAAAAGVKAEAKADGKLESTLEPAISTLVTQFRTFAKKRKSSSTLRKDEFHSLVTSQLPKCVKNASDRGEIDRLMGSLDKNHDGELDFSEFWTLIENLACKQAGFSH